MESYYFSKKLDLNEKIDPFIESGLIVVHSEEKYPMLFQIVSNSRVCTLHSTKLDTYLDFYNKMLLLKNELLNFISFLKNLKVKDLDRTYNTRTFLNLLDSPSNGYIACYYGKSLNNEGQMDAIVSIGDCSSICRIVKNDTIRLYIKRLNNIVKLIEYYEDYIDKTFTIAHDNLIRKLNLIDKNKVI